MHDVIVYTCTCIHTMLFVCKFFFFFFLFFFFSMMRSWILVAFQDGTRLTSWPELYWTFAGTVCPTWRPRISRGCTMTWWNTTSSLWCSTLGRSDQAVVGLDVQRAAAPDMLHWMLSRGDTTAHMPCKCIVYCNELLCTTVMRKC